MSPSNPSSSIVAAAIAGILISLFTILGTLSGIVGLTMLPPSSAMAIPPPARSMLLVIMGLLAGLAIFGVFTCIGVLRLKKWARLSILIWGGVMAAFSGVMLLFTSLSPLPEISADSAAGLPYLRILMCALYGIQFLVGVWWLLLFNQRAVRQQFLPGAATDSQVVALSQPRCPLPLAILSGVSIFSAAFTLLLPFTNFPVNIILFGHRFHGAVGALFFYFSAGLFLAGALGMLRLKRWSYPLVLGQYFFWMVSGTVTLVSPSYDRNLQDMMSQLNLPEGTMTQASFAQTRAFGALALIPGVLIIWLLLYCHTRFEAACAAKAAAGKHTLSPM
jgi:predicted membrane channel-forming protein YqfA (hemolysin III family)